MSSETLGGWLGELRSGLALGGSSGGWGESLIWWESPALRSPQCNGGPKPEGSHSPAMG